MRTTRGTGTAPLAAGAQVLQRDAGAGWLLFSTSKRVSRKVKPILMDVWTSWQHPGPQHYLLTQDMAFLCQVYQTI